MYHPKDYTCDDKIYCYKGTHILKNKLNIQKIRALDKAERYITKLRLMDLELKPIEGTFDFEHLKFIHKKIFSDLYDFAGEIRRVELSKGNSQFCYVQFIESQAHLIFKELKEENFYLNLPKEKLIEKMAHLIGNLIHLHPFREGNGRAIREFVRELCLINNYNIDYSKVSKEKRLDAEILAYHCSYNKLKEVLNKELTKL